jgi:hypothetical protein
LAILPGLGPTATNGVVGSFYNFFASAPAGVLSCRPSFTISGLLNRRETLPFLPANHEFFGGFKDAAKGLRFSKHFLYETLPAVR